MATVTFKYDGSDPDDSTGVSEEEWIELMDGVAALGGYDVEITKD